MNTVQILYILLPILAALTVNGIIFWKRWGSGSGQPSSKLLPSGWVIGTIWTILFGLLGMTMYLHRNNISILIALILLFLICLLYPVYTRGLQGQSRVAKIANMITLVVALMITGMIYANNKKNTWWMLPLILWAFYVNFVDAWECGKRPLSDGAF